MLLQISSMAYSPHVLISCNTESLNRLSQEPSAHLDAQRPQHYRTKLPEHEALRHFPCPSINYHLTLSLVKSKMQ